MRRLVAARSADTVGCGRASPDHDWTHLDAAAPVNGAILRLAELFKRARRPVAFTGAGVSTESGIPDFRSPGGLWIDSISASSRMMTRARTPAVTRDRRRRSAVRDPLTP